MKKRGSRDLPMTCKIHGDLNGNEVYYDKAKSYRSCKKCRNLRSKLRYDSLKKRKPAPISNPMVDDFLSKKW
jgi:hypothetical protein